MVKTLKVTVQNFKREGEFQQKIAGEGKKRKKKGGEKDQHWPKKGVFEKEEWEDET